MRSLIPIAVLFLLLGCAAIERQMQIEATGARFSTTPETAPAAVFGETVEVAGQIIADWCSGATILPSEAARRDLGELLGEFASEFSIEWSLDSQSDDKVVCSAVHDYSRSYEGPDLGSDPLGRARPTGGINYDFVYEWVTFSLATSTRGDTCVVGAPEVRRNDSERQMGSYTNFEEVLAELGGSVPAPEHCQPPDSTSR